MKVAIMQPYFFPYIGYFQLMNSVNEFIVYDNIEYTKKGWINRNRILVNGKDAYITLPIKSDSDFLNIKDRYLADTWKIDRKKMLNKITDAYRRSPYFKKIFPIIEDCLLFDSENLFQFIFYSLNSIKDYLNISTRLIISSTIDIDDSLKSKDRVIAICKERKAAEYLNPIGGVSLYSKMDFKNEGIDIFFLKSSNIQYTQFEYEFIPWLSIIDVLMFNHESDVRRYIEEDYSLI